LLRPVDDLADADDDGNAIFGKRGFVIGHFFFVSLSDVYSVVIASEAKQSMPQQAERWIASSLRSSQ
jgi:hypothetical protein